MEELVGRAIKKNFKGFGVFSGLVKSYDPSSGCFEILYENGASEELQSCELASLVEMQQAADTNRSVNGGSNSCSRIFDPSQHQHSSSKMKPKVVGRKPKKRRRIGMQYEEKDKEIYISASGLVDSVMKKEGFAVGFHLDLAGVSSINGSICDNRNISGDWSERKVDVADGFGPNLATDMSNDAVAKVGVSNGISHQSEFEKDGYDLNGVSSINGNICDTRNISGDWSERKVDVADGFGPNLATDTSNDAVAKVGVSNGISHQSEFVKDGFDLNSRFSWNEELDVNDECVLDNNCRGEIKRINGIDLNLAANSEVDLNSSAEDLDRSAAIAKKRECSFDLNLEVYFEDKQNGVDIEGKSEVTSDSANMGQVQKRMTGGDVDAKYMDDGNESGTVRDHSHNSPLVDDVHVYPVQALRQDASMGLSEGKNGGVIDLEAIDTVEVSNSEYSNKCNPVGLQLNDYPSDSGLLVASECQDEAGSLCKRSGGGRRKRRKLPYTVTETVLRRSSRRRAGQIHDLSVTTSALTSDPSCARAPVNRTTLEEKPKIVENIPKKFQLPPSSQNLNIDEIHLLDLFSIYSVLRSFSNLLFLSPFELEDLVAALRCTFPSTLFDSIHVSVLHTMRKHLEFLSNEGSQSASDCIRCLNWDLLDMVTWPVFMAEYFLLLGKCGFDLNQLKLFRTDYYKQPVSVKIEILNCLCDNMVEVEAIRSELNKRALATDPEVFSDRNVYFGTSKKRRVQVDANDISCSTEKIVDHEIDWNSDECCLCKMDGNLICCDGCPAAFHSRCVGITSNLLPEGDWFCPECAISRCNPWLRLQNSVRGAELLGTDPHGRHYFNSFDYLLVSESVDSISSFKYYHKNDLKNVIEALKSADASYDSILTAICKQWSLLFPFNTPTETHLMKNETSDGRKLKDNSIFGFSDYLGTEVARPGNFSDPLIASGSPIITSDGSFGTTHANYGIRSLQNCGPYNCDRPEEFLKASTVTKDNHGDVLLTSTSSELLPKNNSIVPDTCHGSTLISVEDNTAQFPCEIGYVNHYSFARTASHIAEELIPKYAEKADEIVMAEEDIISSQVKVILKKSAKFCWPDSQSCSPDTAKENCGWCYSCKMLNDDKDCLFRTVMGPVHEVSKSDQHVLHAKRSKDGHLTDIISYIISLQDRLCGLLLGPWLNPNHFTLWHACLLDTSDIGPLKLLLLMLESNLRHLALSADWFEHVDIAVTMGSASHIVVKRHGIGRKRARFLDAESNSSHSNNGLSMFWWRGGQLSRQLFNWKVLPQSLAAKAARQAGCKKIPGILYPDNSEYARRSKCCAWRAAVEAASSIEQLALQVRELDKNIRWDDIENAHPLCTLDKDSRKSARLFKKVIVRRKRTEGEVVKYLLDFGKRRAIPDIVTKHGSALQVSSSERKKYWLDESFLPLHLLRNFEEKRIARKTGDIKPRKDCEVGIMNKRKRQERGLSYLFRKAERSEYLKCGHCNKDVMIREAVSCFYCNGSFHKRHAKKSPGAVATECTYSCYKCQSGIYSKTDTRSDNSSLKGWKSQLRKLKTNPAVGSSVVRRGRKKVWTNRPQMRSLRNKKIMPIVPLRRSARKTRCLSLQHVKVGGSRAGKKTKSKVNYVKANQKKSKLPCRKGKQRKSRASFKKSVKSVSQCKKRKQFYNSYWLNGFLLSRKSNDERVKLFTEKNASGQLIVSRDIIKCHLCNEASHDTSLEYLACELCGVWFHRDAFGLSLETLNQLIGFRCHLCLERAPPVCPNMKINVFQSSETRGSAVIECAEEVYAIIKPSDEVHPE